METTWAQLQVYMNTYITLKALSPITDSRALHVIFFLLFSPLGEHHPWLSMAKARSLGGSAAATSCYWSTRCACARPPARPPPGARRRQPPDLREAKPGREREAERAGGQVLVAHLDLGELDAHPACTPIQLASSMPTERSDSNSDYKTLTGRGGPGSGGAGARCRPRRP